ncbi:MAG: hypothetical protein BMS9Abin13_145 [Patescibacteria group bacterium]|nr:MAG: hypothetical protein BMS9Abin13_145 [Patescibacteria group bacterium]
MKTNKSYIKRLRVTKRGKLLSRKPGGNHFNAKQKRTKQLAAKKPMGFSMKNKDRNRFIPNRRSS